MTHAGYRKIDSGPFVEAVANHGYAVARDFLSGHEITALRGRLRALDADGALNPAGIGRGAQRTLRQDIRGDRIGWLDAVPQDPAEAPLFAALEAFRLAFNRELMLGLFEFEGHYAIYPPGASYARHRDVFRDDDTRTISCVLYLNEAWRAGDGGELRLFVTDATHIDITPGGGTLAAFRSERFDHEVRPTARERLAVTGWFRRRT